MTRDGVDSGMGSCHRAPTAKSTPSTSGEVDATHLVRVDATRLVRLVVESRYGRVERPYWPAVTVSRLVAPVMLPPE